MQCQTIVYHTVVVILPSLSLVYLVPFLYLLEFYLLLCHKEPKLREAAPPHLLLCNGHQEVVHPYLLLHMVMYEENLNPLKCKISQLVDIFGFMQIKEHTIREHAKLMKYNNNMKCVSWSFKVS